MARRVAPSGPRHIPIRVGTRRFGSRGCTGTGGSVPLRPFARHFWYRIPEISSHAGTSRTSRKDSSRFASARGDSVPEAAREPGDRCLCVLLRVIFGTEFRRFLPTPALRVFPAHMTGIRRKRDSQFLLPTRVWSFVDNSAPEECAKENVYSLCRDSAPSALLAKRAECGRPRLSAKAGRTVVPSVRFGTVHKLGRPAFLNSSRPEWMLGLEPHHHEVRSEGARK